MKTFKTEIRARYAETDAAGIVYYGNHFIYFEIGKVDMFRKLKLSYTKNIPIVETYCKYHSQIFFDDLLEIQTRVSEILEKGFKIESKIYNKENKKLLAEGYTVHLSADDEGEIIKVPKIFLDAFKRVKID